MTEPMLQITRSSSASRIAMLAALVIVVVLIAAPWWAGRADMRLMGELFLYLSLASLWNLMAGYAGLVSVGQQAYVGFGGYALFALTIFCRCASGSGYIDGWRVRGTHCYTGGNTGVSFARCLLCHRYLGSC